MSVGAIILLALCSLVWIAVGVRLTRAARRAGERDLIVYVCIAVWPCVAAWLAFEIGRDLTGLAYRLLKRRRRHDWRD